MRTRVTEVATGFEFVQGVRRATTQAVIDGEEVDQDTWEAGCSCGFLSSGWPQRNMAEARITEHQAEHETAGTDEQATTSELVDFKRQVGYDTDVVETAQQTPFADGGQGDEG